MKKDWTQATIKVNDGIELFYTRTGGEKPPVVLSHGITDSGLCWHQFASDLEEDYDLIMYDAYGHGKSSRIDPEKRFDLIEDLHDLVKTLALKPPAIIGHSMGASTAANFAAAYPDLVSVLVLEDPPWMDQVVDEEHARATLQEWKENNLADKKKTLKELVKAKAKESPHWEVTILEAWAQAKLDVDPTIFDQYPIINQKWQDIVKSITCPTLIVTGDQESGAIVTPKLGIEAVELMENCEFGHISSAGHCVRYEQYKPYRTMVQLFLKRNVHRE